MPPDLREFSILNGSVHSNLPPPCASDWLDLHDYSDVSEESDIYGMFWTHNPEWIQSRTYGPGGALDMVCGVLPSGSAVVIKASSHGTDAWLTSRDGAADALRDWTRRNYGLLVEGGPKTDPDALACLPVLRAAYENRQGATLRMFGVAVGRESITVITAR